jgi:hypothetical protein
MIALCVNSMYFIGILPHTRPAASGRSIRKEYNMITGG